jgi:hypothetical protein
LRHRWWLKLIKDYNLTIHYHPGKANVVVDALSRSGVPKVALPLIADLDRLGIALCYSAPLVRRLGCLFNPPSWRECVRLSSRISYCRKLERGMVMVNPGSLPLMRMIWFVSGAIFVTEPPKSLGPPTVVLVPLTLDNPAGAPDHLISSVSEFLTFPRAFHPSCRHYNLSEIRKCGSSYNNLLH